jgi:hypothetical protein
LLALALDFYSERDGVGLGWHGCTLGRRNISRMAPVIVSAKCHRRKKKIRV